MPPLAKNIKRYFSFKEFVIVFLTILISVSTGVGVFLYLKREVVVNDSGKQFVVRTMKTTVGEVLEQNGIKLIPEDYTNLPLDSKLQRGRKNEIFIKRAVPVKILVDGRDTKLMTYRDTIKEALENSPFKMSGEDRLEGANLDDKIARDMTIRIIRVKEELVTEKAAIPFKVVRKENSRMDKGTEKVVQKGKEGIQEKLYKVVYEDGKEIARTLFKDSTVLNPVKEIVQFGTVLNYKTSRGEIIRYKKALKMRATAYTASYADTGKSPGDPAFGITYTGMNVLNIKKGVIAVDPKVIPLGTRVYVEVAGNTPDYGFALAADIGGAIKGDLIDLYFDSQKTVDRWGCKRVKVYILVN